MREAMFADEYQGRPNPIKAPLRRLLLWTMLIWQIVLIGRASLEAEFCPPLSALSLPAEAHQWDADGFPQFMILHLDQWKGNPGRLTQARAQRRRGVASPSRRRRKRQRRVVSRAAAARWAAAQGGRWRAAARGGARRAARGTSRAVHLRICVYAT
jgi:hypothetical protein